LGAGSGAFGEKDKTKPFWATSPLNGETKKRSHFALKACSTKRSQFSPGDLAIGPEYSSSLGRSNANYFIIKENIL
jgi:hypothetical protein